ncbi:MAG: HlyC/CorC family transporter [Anaerolineae bacterium]|nr:HlyC/CorC family transporter [Anaerolineae bacterium]
MELVIILLLNIVNGVLSMSEIAVVSARKVRLSQMAEDGSKGAKRALELAESPNRFLSTVQIGITLVAVLQGAFAGAALAHPVALALARIPLLQPISEVLGLFIVVALTTYLSLVIGELVPKRIGLQNPERIAVAVAPLMHGLSIVTAPFVRLLSISTDALLRLIGARDSGEAPVTEEEIQALIRLGIQAGVFEAQEQEMVAGVMGLDERRVDQIMTPRMDIEWINLDDPVEENLKIITHSHHSRFPAAHGSLDHVVGLVRAKDLLDRLLRAQPVEFNTCIREILFIPESATATQALALFKRSGQHAALVISEYGGIEGMITFNNLVDEIFGETDAPESIQRPDGSWLLDGLVSVDEFKDLFDLKALPGEDDGHYQTLGGFIMERLGRIPDAADSFEWGGLRFEVMDMDGKRVDKVLVARINGEPTAE